MTISTFEELARAAVSDPHAIDVALGAMLVARDVMPELDVETALRDLEALAGPLAGGALAGAAPEEQAAAVSERFRALGFEGNTTDYYDPKNSLLPEVVARKLGIPITLSVVWCDIAKRAGVHARGVAFPGHFLVRVDARGAKPVIVDAFAGGRVVDDDVARDLLRRAIGDGAEIHPALFTPATPRAVLVRMLTNLKAIWASRGEHARAFVAIDRIVTLVPDSARMLRERAAVALKLGANDLAKTDLARVIDLEPEAPDIPVLKARLAQLVSTPKSPLN